MSSQPKPAGTVATRPASAAGSATAWSSAIFGRVGQSSSSRDGSARDRRAGRLRTPGPPHRAGRAARPDAPRTCRRSTGSRRSRDSPRRRSTDGFSTNSCTAYAAGWPAQRVARRGCSRTPATGASARSRSSPASRRGRPRPRCPRSRRNASGSAITWSAAKEPITASGSRRSSIAAARPIAAIESRADGSAMIASPPSSGSCAGHGVAVCPSGHDQEPVRRPAGPAGRRCPAAATGRSRSGRAGTSARTTARAARAGSRHRPPGPRPRSGRSAADGHADAAVMGGSPRTAVTTFDDDPRAAHAAARRPRPPLVTFYDDATGERVELSRDDVRELGGQGRVPARRRARPRARRHAAGRPARALAGPGLPRRRLDRRPGGHRRRRPGRRRVRSRTRSTVGGARRGRVPVLACALLPLGVRFAEPLPDGVHDVGVEVWSQPDAFAPYDPPADADPAYDLGGDRRTHAELVERGRRRDSGHRRRPPPVGGEPDFPIGYRHLRGAARTRRLPGPGRSGRPGAARGDVRRRARHRSLPCLSDQGSGDLSRPGRRSPSRCRAARASRSLVEPWSR